MSSHCRNYRAVMRSLVAVWLLFSSSSLQAQLEGPRPAAPTTQAPSQPKESSDDSDPKLHNYQLQYAKAAEVLKLWKQLHGVKYAATIDERTNSIVFFANETNAHELRESLALMDSESRSPIKLPSPVVPGSSSQGPNPAKSKPAGSFRKFTFKHAKVADVIKILQELAGSTNVEDNMDGFVIDERTNSVIWKVRDEWESQQLDETLLTLDGESSASKIQSVPSPYAAPASMRAPTNFTPTPNSHLSDQSTQTFTFSIGVERGDSLESLKQRYNELEKQTHQLANKVKQAKSPIESDRTEIQAAVRKSFEARQALQRAELADLAQRLKNMQQSIDMRDKLADKVIERRVEDLLNANLKWEVTRTSTESIRTIAKDDSISSSKITSSQEMLTALQGTWTIKTFQADYQGDARLSQVVIRGDLLLMHTIVNGKVLGVSPWKLVWPNAELPYKIGVIWDPNSKAESEPAIPGLLAYDGKSFQLAFGDNPLAICPGENITYLDCIRANSEERSPNTADTEPIAHSSLASSSTPIFSTPQELLARLDECSNNGSYEEFVSLFSDEGVRDLAGSLIVSAMQVTTMTELAKQNGGDLGQGPARIQEALNRWLKPNPTPEQQQAASEALSLMFLVGFGGSVQDQSVVTAYVEGVRKCAERVTDFRKFSVDMLKAYHELTGEPFGYFGKEADREWQVKLSADKAIATLVMKTKQTPALAGIGSNIGEKSSLSNGSEQLPVMTLTNLDGTWRISSLFDELLNVVKPSMEAPSATAPEQSKSKMITRRYSVGSFVTESYFTGKGNYDLKEVYDKYETEIEQSLQDLVKTVTAACSQPPKFVQVLSSSRCLLIGHTEAGHQEIVDFMSDIGISNDRIRLRGFGIEITKDEAKTLDIELSQQIPQQVLSAEQVEKLREFSKSRPSVLENSNDVSFVAMDETLISGTQRPLKINGEFPIPLTIAARIAPASKQIQIRLDMHGLGNTDTEYVAPQFQTLRDGESVLFANLENSYWIATADIVHDTIALAENADKAASIPKALSTPAAEMQQRLQGEWDVKIISFSAGDPKELAIRDGLLLLPGILLGKPIITSMKLEWPNPNMPEEVEIIWEPNNQPGKSIVGRIRCDGEKLQLCFVDGSGKVTQRPREMCGGDGIYYLECTRKQGSKSSMLREDSKADAQSSIGPKYSGHPLEWWLEQYWQNAMANPKTSDNTTEEFIATIAIKKLCETPENDSVIEPVLASWCKSVEHEVNQGQLISAAKCIVTVAGPTHQESAVNFLFKIWKRMPLLTYEEQGEMADDDTELNQLLSQLELNDQLAAQFAKRLTKGDSSDRSLVLYGLLSLMGRFSVKTNDEPIQLENWLRKHAERLVPAIEVACHDENEKVRLTSLIQLATLSHLTSLNAESARLPTILLNATSDTSPPIRSTAILLLTSQELARTVKTQNVVIIPTLIHVIESDSSIDVRYSALDGLMQLDATNELVHKTLLEWAKSDHRERVKYALMLTLRNHQAGNRPQSIDELIELLSDPEWGTNVEIAESNWSTYHRWARQYAIAILEKYAAHAHPAIPTLEAELTRNNKDTLSFATKALDSVRGYCPDRPIQELQGDWEFVSVEQPEGSTPFFDFQAASEQQTSSVITISGTQLKMADGVLAEISHQRQGSGAVMLLAPDSRKRHCNGWYNSKGGQTPESPSTLTLEVCELKNESDATHGTKQTYEFRKLKTESR